jgi:hypothetical protein
MEIVKVELANEERTANDALDGQLQVLNELQLAFVGGGIGDIAM